MRRAERQVTDLTEIRSIVNECKVMRIGLYDGEGPYIVPVNFGYDMASDGSITLYFHSAKEGRKAQALYERKAVAVEMDCSHELVAAEQPCNYSYLYQSLIGTGIPRSIEDPTEKKAALNRIMLHQCGKEFSFADASVKNVAVFEIPLASYTVKQHR